MRMAAGFISADQDDVQPGKETIVVHAVTTHRGGSGHRESYQLRRTATSSSRPIRGVRDLSEEHQ